MSRAFARKRPTSIPMEQGESKKLFSAGIFRYVILLFCVITGQQCPCQRYEVSGPVLVNFLQPICGRLSLPGTHVVLYSASSGGEYRLRLLAVKRCRQVFVENVDIFPMLVHANILLRPAPLQPAGLAETDLLIRSSLRSVSKPASWLFTHTQNCE